MSGPGRDMGNITVYAPLWLRDYVREAAKRERRTISQMAVLLLVAGIRSRYGAQGEGSKPVHDLLLAADRVANNPTEARLTALREAAAAVRAAK